MVSIVPSDYTDIQKLAQRIPEHPSDILVQRYEANSYSNQSVRWSITANSPNSLLDSEVYLYARIKLDIKDSTPAGAALAVTHSKLREQTSQKRDYNVLKVTAKPDQTYWDTPVTIGANKNLGFCQRQVSGFWNAVDSLTVELNSATSVSVRPSDWIWATDEFLVTARVVGKIERLGSLSLVIHDHGEGLGTDIDLDMIELQWSLLFV